VLLRTDVFRRHPVGVRLGPVVAMWPGWGATLKAIARDPVADLDWIDVVGPADAAHERLLAGAVDDATVDARLVALQAMSTEPGSLHVEGGVPAASAPLDGALRVVFRPQAHIVAAAPAAIGLALSRSLRDVRVRAPAAEAEEALRADLSHPHDAVARVPSQIQQLRVRVLALPNGGADAKAEGDCAGAQAAEQAAAEMRSMVTETNGLVVRMLTRGLLDGIDISAQGAKVRIHLPATRDQLEALLALVLVSVPQAAP
jgi:hypothetical protein